MHPDLNIGRVALTVANLERSLKFYEEIIGMQVRQRDEKTAHLGTSERDLLLLTEIPNGVMMAGTTGLYHFALLVPTRLDLALWLKHMIDTRMPAHGFADHDVSEAIYLGDPDGHGIEVYCDRPRDQWRYKDGELVMGTAPLDLNGIYMELAGHPQPWSGLAPGTVMGHIHLHVARIPAAEAFYTDTLGFDLIVRYGESASFLSAGGYHHHIGVNTWAGLDAPPPPTNAVGLQWYEVCLSDSGEVEKTAARLRDGGLEVEERDEGYLLHDPAANGIMLTAR